jgi:hypothetical protein
MSRIPWNKKVHNRIPKSPLRVSLLIQNIRLPAIPTYVFEGVVLNSPRVTFRHMQMVTVTRSPLTQSLKWRTDFCQLSATACSIFSELPAVYGGSTMLSATGDAPCCYVRESQPYGFCVLVLALLFVFGSYC